MRRTPRICAVVAFCLWAPIARAPIARAQPGNGVTLTVGRHDTRGGTFNDPVGPLLDLLITGRLVKRANWAIVLGGGAWLVLRDSSDDCTILPEGGCAPDGDMAGLNALVGLATYAGPTELRFGTGLAFLSRDRTISRGLQWRLDVMQRDPSAALGAMARATFVPASQGVRRDDYDIGFFLRFR